MAPGDLARHVAALRERSPFYRDKLAGIEDAPFEALPFTTKDEIRESLAAEPPLGRHLAAPLEDVRRIYSSSGTTGDPSYIAVTQADLEGWTEIGARSYAATGIAPSQRAVLTYNSGPFVAGAVLDAWARIGATTIPVGSGNTERLVRAFQVLGAEALGCTPSYALYLADWCRERGIEPRELGVRLFSVAGEPGGGEDATRHAIEEAFGATVREAMGIADVSPSLWGECEEQAGMHFSGEGHVHVELIDPESGDGAPVRGSSRGRARLHVAAPRGDAGAALPLPRPRGGQREAVLMRARRHPRALHRPHRRPPDRPRRQPLPDRAARGGRGVRRRPDPDPPRARRRPPGRAAAGAGRGRGRPRSRPRARDPRRDPRRLVVTTEVELVPYGTLPRSEYKSKLVDFGESATR